METVEHQFTPVIQKILKKHFGEYAEAIFSASPLVGYLNIKTKAASKGSKSRASLGNLYALYVLIEDYLILYKTGCTNANDGGIDFVMKPLGTFSSYGDAERSQILSRHR